MKEIKLLFQNSDFVIINKPANLNFHSEDNKAGLVVLTSKLLYPENTSSFLTAHEKQLYSVHRLDKMTSGLLLLAKTKEAAHKTFETLGLDISTAVKMFLRKAVATNSIPFEVRTENGRTHAQEQSILSETATTLKNGKRYSSMEDAHKDVLGEAQFNKLIGKC